MRPERLLAALLLLGACSKDEPGPPLVAEQIRIELIDRLPWAQVAQETHEIRFGTEAGKLHYEEPDPRLHGAASGFLSFEESGEGGRSLALAVGREARVRFTSFRQGDVAVTLEAFGLDDGKGSQDVTVLLAGRDEPVARFTLPPPVGSDPAVKRAFKLPAHAITDGANELVFAFGRTDARAFPLRGEPFRWPVAGAFARLTFGRGSDRGREQAPAPLPDATAERNALVLAEGTRTSFALRLPPVAPRFTARIGEHGEPITFRVRADTGIWLEERIDSTPRDFPRNMDWDLSLLAGQAVELEIALDPAPRQDGVSRVRIEAPTIEGGNVFVPQPASAGPRAERANIAVILLDAAARRHFPTYGASRATAPAVDRLAADALVFDGASSPASYTLPSVASLFTGLFADRHGVIDVTRRLPDDVPTLAETLQDAGYETLAMVTNPNAGAAFGLDRGFATYDALYDDPSVYSEGVPADALAPRLAAHLDAGRLEPPFFLYLHVFQPHAPYAPPAAHCDGLVAPGYAGPADGSRRSLDDHRHHVIDGYGEHDLQALSERYDANLRWADTAVAAALDELARRDVLDDTIVLVVGDHGEAFGQHGSLEHGETVFAEEVDIPFVLKLPARAKAAPSRDPRLVSLVDVLPTLLSAVGVPRGNGDGARELDGIDLLQDADAAERPLYLRSSGVAPRFAIRARGFSYHEDVRTRWRALFDLAADPLETTNLAAARPILAETLRTELGRHLAECARADHADAEVDDATLEKVAQLGYTTSGSRASSPLAPLMHRPAAR